MAKEFDTVSELVRMALIYAMQDRESMLGCLSAEDEYRPQVVRELAEFRRYYNKRFRQLTPSQAEARAVETGKVRYVTLAEIQAEADARAARRGMWR